MNDDSSDVIGVEQYSEYVSASDLTTSSANSSLHNKLVSELSDMAEHGGGNQRRRAHSIRGGGEEKRRRCGNKHGRLRFVEE